MFKIECKTKTKDKKKKIRVRIIKAPIINSEELRGYAFARDNAPVL